MPANTSFSPKLANSTKHPTDQRKWGCHYSDKLKTSVPCRNGQAWVRGAVPGTQSDHWSRQVMVPARNLQACHWQRQPECPKPNASVSTILLPQLGCNSSTARYLGLHRIVTPSSLCFSSVTVLCLTCARAGSHPISVTVVMVSPLPR